MTTTKKPSQKVPNNDRRATKSAWYRAPIVWLGIALSALLLFGYIRLIVISHQNSVEQPRPAAQTTDKKQLTQILGMPLAPHTSTHADKP